MAIFSFVRPFLKVGPDKIYAQVRDQSASTIDLKIGIEMHRYRKLRWPLIGLLIARFCMVLS